MNTALECEQTLLVQAEFDGELDAGRAAPLVRHRQECARCREVEETLVRTRALMRAAPRYGSSAGLRERLSGAIGATGAIEDAQRPRGESGLGAASPPGRSVSVARRGSWWASAGWAAAAAGVLVAIIFSSGGPRPADVGSQLVSNHLRALQLESHLVDVVSTDHHTVKPWFAGKVDFAPPVKQLDAQGYVLEGGRIDVVDARTAAVLVYQAGQHTVEVFIWPAATQSATRSSREPESQQLDGFNLRRWQESGFEIWCISDMASEALDTFAQRWREAR